MPRTTEWTCRQCEMKFARTKRSAYLDHERNCLPLELGERVEYEEGKFGTVIDLQKWCIEAGVAFVWIKGDDHLVYPKYWSEIIRIIPYTHS